MKSSGLYENSVIVLYGDHYGVSNSRNQNLAELVGKTKADWNDFDNANMQRVPYMIHVPGQENGGVNHTYGGKLMPYQPFYTCLVSIRKTTFS